MIGEISLAAGFLGKIFDMTKSGSKDKTDEVASSDEFAAMMGGQNGISISMLPTAAKDEDAGLSAVSGDNTDAAASAAFDYLKEMTAGGLEGAMKTAMKKLRDKVMEEMGVSQEQLDAMPPEQRAGIEAKIAEEVQKRMKEAMGVAENGAVDQDKMKDFGARLAEASKAYKGGSASEMLSQLLGV